MQVLKQRARCTQTGECRQLCLAVKWEHGTGQGGGMESREGFLRWEDADRDCKRRQDGGRGSDRRSLRRWVGGP